MSGNANAPRLPGNYDARHKIPTISQFIDRLDKEKAERDQQVDEAEAYNQSSDARDHQNAKVVPKKDQKIVKDPVTGKDVTIQDVNSDTVKRAQDPVVSLPPVAVHVGPV